jgi:nicotinamidase-related amidase
MAVRRMVAAGIVPITWLAVLSEWQRDWARTDTLEALTVSSRHGGGSAFAFAWEMQLLGTTSRRS